MKGLLIFLLIIVIYMILFKSGCNMCNEGMENSMFANNKNDNDVGVNNDFSSIDEVFPKPPQTNKNQRIDLEKLPECKMPMKIEFSNNINNMMNNGNQIYQDIIRPNGQRSIIGNDNLNLKQISWTKSKLNWHGEELPLEIRLTNINNETGRLTHIIFPVKLIDEKLTEKFDNSFFGLDNGRDLNNEKTIENFDLNIDFIKNSFAGKLYSDVKEDVTYYTDKLFGLFKKDSTILDLNKNILNTTQNILNSNPVAQRLLNQTELKNLINATTEIAKSKGVNVDVNKLINEQIGKKITDEAKKIVTEIAKENPNVTKKLELDKPEVATKVVEVKDKLSTIDLKKIDLVSVVNKVETQELDKLRVKLEKINFNQVAKNFDNQQFSTYDINSLMNLNSLIKDKSNVPTYKCCTPNYGKIVSIDLCQTGQKVLDQEKFFFASGNDNSLILITKPQPYNKTIGEQMIKNLEEPSNLF
jgi:hypothetical protein